MAKPAILTVDDDPVVSQAIARDLRRRNGAEYQVVRATSGASMKRVASAVGEGAMSAYLVHRYLATI